MYQIIGLVYIILAIALISGWYKKDGILCLLDFSRVMSLIWMVSIGLYDLALSSLLKPDIFINVIVFIIVVCFLLNQRYSESDARLIKKNITSINIPKSIPYWIAILVIILMVFYSFTMNYESGTLRLISGSKSYGKSLQLGYIYRLSVLLCIVFYMTYRLCKNKLHKIILIILFIVNLYITITDYSRGPILFIIINIFIFEVVNYFVRRKDTSISIKTIVLLLVSISIMIYGFGAIGDSRTDALFGVSALDGYKMKYELPRGITWIYIYLASPMENAKQALEFMPVDSYTFFANLFYPIIKSVLNIINLGDIFSNWVEYSKEVYPYLWNHAGLNASSFILDATQDGSLFAVFVYIFIYICISRLAKKVIKSSRITEFTKLIAYGLLFEIPLWSIFVNSAFKGSADIWILFLTAIVIDYFFIKRDSYEH